MEATQEAQRRAMILRFWNTHGLSATQDAYGVGRSTLFLWQRKLWDGKGKLSSLNQKSRRPKSLRTMTTPSHVIQRVCQLRCAFPHYGPKKLVILLGEEGIVLGHTTVGKIIGRYDLPRAPRQYVARKRRRERKQRLPKKFTAKRPGDLVSMDTVVLQENGRKKYIVTALDHASRMALARVYATHSSRQAKDLLERMHLVLGRPIRKVLTDNGSEFEAHYDACCTALTIEHCWTYPRSPRMNGHTERFNRTIQEEARFPPFSASLEEWNAWIAHYILEYNCYRPHQSLSYKRPIDFYVALLKPKSKEQSNMYVGHTKDGGDGGECPTLLPCACVRRTWQYSSSPSSPSPRSADRSRMVSRQSTTASSSWGIWPCGASRPRVG